MCPSESRCSSAAELLFYNHRLPTTAQFDIATVAETASKHATSSDNVPAWPERFRLLSRTSGKATHPTLPSAACLSQLRVKIIVRRAWWRELGKGQVHVRTKMLLSLLL